METIYDLLKKGITGGTSSEGWERFQDWHSKKGCELSEAEQLEWILSSKRIDDRTKQWLIKQINDWSSTIVQEKELLLSIHDHDKYRPTLEEYFQKSERDHREDLITLLFSFVLLVALYIVLIVYNLGMFMGIVVFIYLFVAIRKAWGKCKYHYCQAEADAFEEKLLKSSFFKELSCLHEEGNDLNEFFRVIGAWESNKEPPQGF